MINKNEIKLLEDGLDTLATGFADLPEFTPGFDSNAIAAVITEVAERMQNNYPYFHPQYAGQMLKPPHPVARIAYAMSLWVNPNNHALDGGRASSAMEKECIVELGAMFDWQDPLGHLTGGGTMANLEALWVAGRLHPGKRIIGSEQAHYTHSRISEVLRIPYSAVPVRVDGRMDVDAVERQLRKGDVGTVVVTMGNTGLGAVDPLAEILALRSKYDKHGLQPYGCGCVMFKDAAVGKFYKHDSPYTYFSSGDLHLGEITLECSRPGASAVALWATQRLLPLHEGGEFAANLDSSLSAARDLHAKLVASDHFVPLMAPQLDIVVYAVKAPTTTQSSERARKLFENAFRHGLHLALMELPMSLAGHWLPDIEGDAETITCLRSVLMKPEHEQWTDRIIELLEDCVA